MFSVKPVGVAMAKDCLPLAMKEVVSFSRGIVATIGHSKENAASDYHDRDRAESVDARIRLTVRKPRRVVKYGDRDYSLMTTNPCTHV
jgi:hypothetical protein